MRVTGMQVAAAVLAAAEGEVEPVVHERRGAARRRRARAPAFGDRALRARRARAATRLARRVARSAASTVLIASRISFSGDDLPR